jgi:15-cis-phytoene desaturase
MGAAMRRATSDGHEVADVVVVGGGIAGLTAALGLRHAGLRVVVLERDGALGGRARSFTDPRTGDPIDLGPHVLLSEYPNFMRLLTLAGTRERVVWQPDPLITLFDGPERLDVAWSRLPQPFAFVPSVLRDRHESLRDELSNVPLTLWALGLGEPDLLRLDALNAPALLRSFGVTAHEIERFWGFVSTSICNVPIELCSAGALMRFYAELAGRTRYAIGFPDGGLGDLFVPGASRLLELHDAAVRTEAPVRRLLDDGERASGVELEDGTRIEARFCVAAVPAHVLARLLPEAWCARHAALQGLSALEPCPYVSAYLWFDRKLGELRFWARRPSPLGLGCDFYDLSNIRPGGSGRPSLVAMNAIYAHRCEGLSDDAIVARALQELSEALPAAADARLEHAVVHRVPMAIHCPYPGTERRRLPARAPVPGLVLAGDWTATGLPASMESAARSGWLAAEAVLAELGRPEPLAVTLPATRGLAGVLREVEPRLPGFRLPMRRLGV